MEYNELNNKELCFETVPNYPSQNIYPSSNQSNQFPNEISERKNFRGKVEYMGLGLLIYTIIIYGIYIADMLGHYVYYSITCANKEEYDKAIQEYGIALFEGATPMIIGVIVGVLTLMLLFIKALPIQKIFAHHRKITFSKLMMLLSVLMGCQLIFFYMDLGVEWLLNQIGLSLQAAIESSQAGSTTVSMFMYAGFIGPIVEEIVYRGFVMHTFERVGCGKFCSILVSSILFGLMHANPTQSIYATYVGLIFAYTAMEFGIGWSMVLHITNNFLFGDVLTHIENMLPELPATILSYSVLIAFLIAGTVVLIAKRKQIISYIKANNQPTKHYSWIFTCITMLAFIAMNVLFAMLSFTQLNE